MKLNSVVGFTVIVILSLLLVQSYENSLEKTNGNGSHTLSKPRKQKGSYQNSLEKSNGNALSKPRKQKGSYQKSLEKSNGNALSKPRKLKGRRL